MFLQWLQQGILQNSIHSTLYHKCIKKHTANADNPYSAKLNADLPNYWSGFRFRWKCLSESPSNVVS
jgi:hypothetical protein